MAEVTRRRVLCGFAAMGLGWFRPGAAICRADDEVLYGQATGAMLDREFPSARVEYLLLDAGSGRTIAGRWDHADAAIPVGSLLKPFVALAYGEIHAKPAGVAHAGADFPTVVCHGKIDGCWRAAGHGSLGLERALAVSCNAYFLKLARELSETAGGWEALRRMAGGYGLPAPPEGFAGERAARMLIGVTPEWRVSPGALTRAYARLATVDGSKTAQRLRVGMQMAASAGGTAARIGAHQNSALGSVLAKTGTAPCVQGPTESPCLASGDGLVVAIAGVEHPKLLLLVRERGTTGAQTAEVAGKMLSWVESDGKGR